MTSSWSLGDREDIFITHLFIIIKSEVSTFPIVVIFPCFCAGCGYSITCCRFHIHPGKTRFCNFYYCAVLWCAQITQYIMTRWSCSFVYTLHYLIFIIMQTYLKVLKCLIKSNLPIIFHVIYGAVCIQPTHFSCDDCENTCFNFIIIIKYEVWPEPFLWQGHETKVCAGCFSIFLWLIVSWILYIIFWCNFIHSIPSWWWRH